MYQSDGVRCSVMTQGGKMAAQYDKESKGERNLAFKPVCLIYLPRKSSVNRKVI